MLLCDLNLFVTGGCGFIGSNFCNYIATKVKRLVIIDKLDYMNNEKNINNILKLPNVVFIKDNLTNHNFEETFAKYEINYIIHFAAQTHVDNSYNNFNIFIDDNIIATHKLLDAIYKFNKDIKLIHFSTDEIYGSWETKEYFNELSNYNPTNPYATTKASCEMFVNTYKYTYKLPIIITRCNNVYGKYQYYEKVIPLFINNVLNNLDITIHGEGNYIRDFIHVNDVIDAILVIIEKGEYGEIYNIGVDNPIKIIDLANMIIDKIGTGNISYIKDRAFNDYRYPLDSSKLKGLGWKAKIEFTNGLDEVIDWIKENNDYFNVINGKTYKDNRGKLQMIPLPSTSIKQQMISTNKKDVFRGLHASPYGKHVVCIKGSFIDYVVNFEDFTYKKYYLSSDKLNKIYVPPNHGHGFLSLEEDSAILYQIEGEYNAVNEKNINFLCPYINLDVPFNNNYILSHIDKNSSFSKPVDYVVLGSNGFLGGEMVKILKKQNKNYIEINTRLENTELLEKQLSFYKPEYIINASGISGKPTTKWSETNKLETMNINVIYQLTLANICKKLNIKVVYFASGSIYKNDNNKLYTEDDEPNNDDLYYLECRLILEKALKPFYDNILILRINYPISLNDNPKCLINKLHNNLHSINDIEINTTIIPDLFPKITYLLEEKNASGILNFVNKDTISLPHLLNLSNITDFVINKDYKNTIGFLNTDKLNSLLDNKLNSIIDTFNSENKVKYLFYDI